MSKHTYIFGHRNPDSDSICSSIAYAKLKRLMGNDNVSAYALGALNRETKFILDYFNVVHPDILTSIRPTLKDLDLYKPVKLRVTDSVKMAWDILSENRKSRIVPIVDENDQMKGIISVGNIMGLYMQSMEEIDKYEIRFENLMSVLNVKKMHGIYPYETVEGRVYIGSASLNNEDMTKKDIFITSSLDDAKILAEKGTCGCIILTNSLSIEAFKEYSAAVVSVDCTLMKTLNLVNQAVSVGSLMVSDGITSFSSDAEVVDTIAIVQSSTHRNFPVVDREGRVFGVVSRRHLIEYDKKKVILMDHNERSQSVLGLEQAEIIEIIDHHRVADVQTDSPLFIRAEPVGSTSTIVYKMYMENRMPISKDIAGILLSAILSDTLMFSSPTSTPDDEMAVRYLAQIAEVNVEEYGKEMFTVATSLAGYTPEDILAVDRKKFTFGKNTTFISQINTLDFSSIEAMEENLLNAMQSYVDRHGCDIALLMITDIVRGGSEILVAGRNKDLVYRTFGIDHKLGKGFLEGVVSRKKQVVPRLTMASS